MDLARVHEHTLVIILGTQHTQVRSILHTEYGVQSAPLISVRPIPLEAPTLLLDRLANNGCFPSSPSPLPRSRRHPEVRVTLPRSGCATYV